VKILKSRNVTGLSVEFRDFDTSGFGAPGVKRQSCMSTQLPEIAKRKSQKVGSQSFVEGHG
jgi:hypothetical protein